MNTAVADIQDALKTAIDAQTPGVAVSVGYPKGGPKDRHIWVSGEAEVTAASQLASYETREESVDLGVFCYAQVTTADYTVARDACLALVAEVEAALAADRTLGGKVEFCEVTRIRLDEGVPNDTQRAVGATLGISCLSVV